MTRLVIAFCIELGLLLSNGCVNHFLRMGHREFVRFLIISVELFDFRRGSVNVVGVLCT